MDPVTLSALIGGGIAVGTSALNAGLTVGRNRAARKWSEEQWQRENEYNLPSNQVQRLKDAGLNPYLAYGQGSVTGSTSASAQQYSPQAIQFENPAPYLSSFAQVQKTNAETDNINMNSDYQAQQIVNLGTQDFLNRLYADRQQMDNKVFRQLLPYRLEEFKRNQAMISAQIANFRANAGLSLAQKNLALANTAGVLLNNSYIRKDKEWQYKLNNIQYQSTAAGIRNLQLNSDLLQKQVNVFDDQYRANSEEQWHRIQGMKWNNMRSMYDMNQSKYDFFNKRYDYNIKNSIGYNSGSGGMFAPLFDLASNFLYNFNKRPFIKF